MQTEDTSFISYSRSLVVKMQDEGRSDAANKLNMYLRKFITFLARTRYPSRILMLFLYGTTTFGLKTRNSDATQYLSISATLRECTNWLLQME